MPRTRQSLTAKAPRRGAQEGASDWFRFTNVSNDRVQLEIYGQIGGFSWWDEDEPVTGKSLRRELKNHKGKDLEVHINSPGGSVFEGLAIYNALKQHDGEVRVVVDALAASAASFVAMAADDGQLVMARNAVMMIHDASGVAIGNAADMRDMAELLEKHSDNIADIYAQRSGEDATFWRMAMIEETWYTGLEAVEAGLADSVLEDEDEEAEKVAASWDLSIYNHAGREQAPAPSVIHKRIKSQMNQAKESTVGKPAGQTVNNEGENPPAEGDNPPVEEENPSVEETGADGDGQPTEGTQPPAAPAEDAEPVPPAPQEAQNSLAPGTYVINGVPTTDPTAVQRHITALETAAREARDGSRTEFVDQLVTSNRLPAPQRDATVEFALELSDAQYEKWTAQWTNAASLPLLGMHGGGSTESTTSPQQAAVSNDELETALEIVAQHKRAGRPEAFIKNTKSYQTVIAHKPDFKL